MLKMSKIFVVLKIRNWKLFKQRKLQKHRENACSNRYFKI